MPAKITTRPAGLSITRPEKVESSEPFPLPNNGFNGMNELWKLQSCRRKLRKWSEVVTYNTLGALGARKRREAVS
jgi:hypothetical protein